MQKPLPWPRKLETFQRKRGERRAFVATMQDLTTGHRSSPEMLEFLSELFNSSNRENDYCQTLLKLFDLYVSTGNFREPGSAWIARPMWITMSAGIRNDWIS